MLRVGYAKTNAKSKNATLYVAYLSPNINSEEKLNKLFQPHGKVVEAKVLYHENGQVKGVGFVKFENRQEAESAIRTLNGSTDMNICNGTHPLVVKYSEQDKKRIGPGGLKGNLRGGNRNNQMMTGYRHNPMGGINSAYSRAPNPYAAAYPQMAGVSSDASSQYSMAYNNMSYTNPAYAGAYTNTAFAAGYGTADPSYASAYGATPVDPTYASAYGASTVPAYGMPPVASGPDGSFCLFVYNLPPETDDNLLYRIFGPYGAIVSVKVVKEPTTGQCRGYSFVNFSKYEEAYAAIAALNGTKLKNKYLQVSFKKSN